MTNMSTSALHIILINAGFFYLYVNYNRNVSRYKDLNI